MNRVATAIQNQAEARNRLSRRLFRLNVIPTAAKVVAFATAWQALT